MILTRPDSLPQVVSDYISSPGAGITPVFGGPSAVSETVVNQLHQLLGA